MDGWTHAVVVFAEVRDWGSPRHIGGVKRRTKWGGYFGTNGVYTSTTPERNGGRTGVSRRASLLYRWRNGFACRQTPSVTITRRLSAVRKIDYYERNTRHERARYDTGSSQVARTDIRGGYVELETGGGSAVFEKRFRTRRIVVFVIPVIDGHGKHGTVFTIPELFTPGNVYGRFQNERVIW